MKGGERYHAPDGALASNRELLPGTTVTELRLHPFIDRRLDGAWNYEPEVVKFKILAVERTSYRCQYIGEQDTFFWPMWDKQPHYGFMKDGCTPVLYYLPEPYSCGQGTLCPYTIRCNEIDDLTLLVRDAGAFAQAAAAERQLSGDRRACYFRKPSKRQISEDLCPFFAGSWSDGAVTNVVCSLAPVQLHGYCEIKLCESGRKVYCPIWRRHGGDGDMHG